MNKNHLSVNQNPFKFIRQYTIHIYTNLSII